jgi:hypothetical protein
MSQEFGMLCPHILQSSLGLVNTWMIQDTVALPEWQGVLTDADRRGLTRIVHANMTPYRRSSCEPTAAWTSPVSRLTAMFRRETGTPILCSCT